MDTNRHNRLENLSIMLFQPKTFMLFALLWLLFVVIGSGLAIGASKLSILSDSKVEAILSENERLANATNVAYTEGSDARSLEELLQNSAPVFPDRLIVPSLGIDLPISNPQTRNIDALDEELKSAVVRYPDAATLGVDGGNVLIFGHSSHLPIVRNKLYKAFNDIEKLSDGQIIEAVSGIDTYSYRVTRVYEANAADNDKIALAVPGHRITLLTCDTFGKKSDRWVVEAEFVGKNI